MSGVTENYVYLGEKWKIFDRGIWRKSILRLHIFAETKKSEFQGLYHEYLTGS